MDSFDGIFMYKSRTIYYTRWSIGNEGNNIYVYYDPVRASHELSSALNRDASSWTNECFTDLKSLQASRYGYFAFVSNIDDHPREVYGLYKERQLIEDMFDYLKNIMDPGPSYAHNDAYIRGWAFINHISLLYYYALLSSLQNTPLFPRTSPMDIIDNARNVFAVELKPNEYSISQISDKTVQQFIALGVIFPAAAPLQSPSMVQCRDSDYVVCLISARGV